MTLQLEIANLSVTFGSRNVLPDISLPPFSGGELVSLVGPNGAGKTTLLRAIAGLLPASGAVLLDGKDLTQVSLRERARHVAYMPQTLPHGAALTVLETVIAALLASPTDGGPATEIEAARQAAAQLDMLDALPIAGRRLDQLSGGQRQLVGLAQALARKPRVLLLDEPTSALDLRHQHQVMDLARTYARETGAVVITVLHDLQASARISDRMVVLEHGRIVSDGSPRQALTPALLAQVWKVEARIEHCSNGLLQVMVDGVL